MARAMMVKILMSILATTMLVQLALAVDHSVGSPGGGWDTSTNLGSWASSETFTVGDNIVFTFTPNHNVYEVSKDDYDSCSTSSPVSTNSLTPTTLKLTETGTRYFICGTPGHCDQGMKVEIKTEAATTTSASPPPPTTTTTTAPPSSESPAPPVYASSPPSTDSKTPPVSKPEQPVSGDEPPKPSSAAVEKMSVVVSMLGIGFLMMM